MEWRDAGIILGLRRHGETSVIAEVMTREHGRHLGLVRGGRARRMQPILQPGNEVEAVWRARLEEQLGLFSIEAGELHAATALSDPYALHGANLLCALLRLFAERDPHSALFESALIVLRQMGDPDIGPALMVRFELAVLRELGFGLDLTRCAVTGLAQELAYVSPKSGRAVSRPAGELWKDRLLVLPNFLQEGWRESQPNAKEIAAAFKLTGHFLLRNVLEPRGLAPIDARRAYLALSAAAQI